MNKSLLILALSATFTLSAAAKYQGPGYYRIQNYATERYLYVVDNRAEIDYTASDVDMNGVELWRGADLMVFHPATVVYVTEVGSDYDIQAQGTGIHKMSDIYLKIRPVDGTDAYLAYGSSKGITKYLGDPEASKRQQMSYLASSASGTYRYWYLKPMTTTDDNYFGILPTLEANGKYYASHFADFPFTPHSAGVTAYVVSKIDTARAIAVITPVTDGVIPSATPVIFTCTSSDPSNNRLNVGAGTEAKIPANYLKGNYFDNLGEGGHYNRTAFNPSTMRVLGITKSGRAGLVNVSSTGFLAINSAYLTVSADCPAELTLMTEQEYDEAGIDNVQADATNAPFDIYNTQGVRVRAGVTSVSNLPAGIYIANGKKIVVR